MFERYTEKARRAVFFGRYQATKFGSEYIQPHHLLLGVVQTAQEGGAESAFLTPGMLQELEQEFADLKSDARIATSVDLPLSHSAKKALAFAAERPGDSRKFEIDLVDLLAGLIQADGRVATTLAQRGIDLRVCREELGSASPATTERAAIIRALNVLPADRLKAAAQMIDALGDARVKLVVETDGGTFTAEFK